MPGVNLEVGLSGAKPGQLVKLEGDRVLVGRAPDCTVRIHTDVVSRRHCVLWLEHGRWMVKDLGSSNGTFLNRRRISQAEVRHGDILRIGEGGPKLRVLSLDPAPPDFEDADLLATRTHPPPGIASAEYEVSVRESAVARPARRRARAPARTVRSPAPWIVVAGLLFGVLTGFEAWSEFFPYEEFAAPCLWATHGLARAWPAIVVPKLGWVLVIALGAYWGLLGFVLQRPARRWPLMVAMAVAHTACYMVVEQLVA